MQKKISIFKISATMVYDFLHKSIFWLPFWLIFGAILSATQKYDFNWDFTNYHLYNPWRLLDGRNYAIYTPLATINSFFNPLIDVPLYLLIKYFNNYPTMIYAIQGLWFGGLIFVFQKITLLFFKDKSYRNIFCILLTMAVAITGQATLKQAGASTNEVPIAMLILIGVYHILKLQLYPDKQKISAFFISGLVMGLALGLKQTCLPYAFAVGFTLILFYKNLRQPYKFIGAFISGGFIGCITVYGYFLYDNFVNYGNPFMPFLNEYFKSEYFDVYNFQDRRFMPKLNEFLYYPYLWENRAAEINFTDKRGAIFYTLSWIFAIYAIGYYLLKHRKAPFFNSRLNSFTCVYMLISYLLWSALFSIFRYLIPLEMFFAIFIVKTCNALLFRYYNKYTIVLQLVITELLFYTLLSVPHGANWGQMGYSKRHKFTDIQQLILPENTLIKFYNIPIGALAPLIAWNNPHFKAVIFVDEASGMHTDFTEHRKFAELRQRAINIHTGPVIYIFTGWTINYINRKIFLLQNKAEEADQALQDLEDQLAFEQQKHYKNVLLDYHKKSGREAIDEETVLRLLNGADKNNLLKNLPTNEELNNLDCRRLRNNLNFNFMTCVPKELSGKIFKYVPKE
jgi:hypothetical protein